LKTDATDTDQALDPVANCEKTKRQIGYIPRDQATPEIYTGLGFMCGLEIHQQLLTDKKLFCNCPAGIFQKDGEYDAEVIRHMRPTLSEMGEYDGTALMEKRTKKNIFYRLKNETACTYDIDDTPPFLINRQALDRALEISLMLGTSIVGELHITRKQYLDGSIPTGFQRTAIVGIEGEIPLKNKKVKIIQLSIEEDSCREVSDIGHDRVYTTDRLGMPLIETVTYPEMLTPDEAAEAGQYLRLLCRTSGKVRTGIGAARQDVNVSITGGTRVEIKGVAHINWIPELTHNEAFRQKALLTIRDRLNETVTDSKSWALKSADVEVDKFDKTPELLVRVKENGHRLAAVNLPHFRGLLSFFTQPGKRFANELADRLKVIACLERPNLLHSEQTPAMVDESDWGAIRQMLGAGPEDAQLLIWGPSDDVTTALDTISERCLWAFEGVPNETRKSFRDGTTIFERVLPGPDRMYPDTDSAPIPIEEEHIERIRSCLTVPLSETIGKLREWNVPEDTFYYLVTRKLLSRIEDIAAATGWPHRFISILFGHTVKGLQRTKSESPGFTFEKVSQLCRLVREKELHPDLVKATLPEVCASPDMPLAAILDSSEKELLTEDQTRAKITELVIRFEKERTSKHPAACQRWVMGQLRRSLLGHIPLATLAVWVGEEVKNV